MKYELSDAQNSLAEAVTRFLEGTAPVASRREWLGKAKGKGYRALWQKCAELGLAGVFSARDGGGSVSGYPLSDGAIIAEIAGASLTPMPFIGTCLSVAALNHPPYAGQIEGDISSGAAIAAFAVEEEFGVWEPGQVGTMARIDGDELCIEGRKIMVADATSADLFCVICRIGDGVAAVIVPATTSGVKITSCKSLDLLRDYGTVEMRGVRVARSAAATTSSDAVAALIRQAQCLHLAESVGALDALFNMTVDYTRERYAFGRPIGSFQALKHRIATLMLWVESSKAIVDSAVAAVDADGEDAAMLVAIAKAYVGDKSVLVAQECTQIFGGVGLTYEHDAHLYLRRLTVNRALLGTPEQHRLRVADHLDIASATGALQ